MVIRIVILSVAFPHKTQPIFPSWMASHQTCSAGCVCSWERSRENVPTGMRRRLCQTNQTFVIPLPLLSPSGKPELSGPQLIQFRLDWPLASIWPLSAAVSNLRIKKKLKTHSNNDQSSIRVQVYFLQDVRFISWNLRLMQHSFTHKTFYKSGPVLTPVQLHGLRAQFRKWTPQWSMHSKCSRRYRKCIFSHNCHTLACMIQPKSGKVTETWAKC